MIFSNAYIVLEDKVLLGELTIENDLITAIKEMTEINGINLNKAIIFPGFIDTHIHGMNNVDFMDSDGDLNVIFNNALKEGTTSLLATTMTSSVENIINAVKNISKYKETTGAKLLGIHLEGPFINKKYKGAQNSDHIIPFNAEFFNKINEHSNHLIKIVTIAPELQDYEELSKINNEDIIFSIGHSYANHQEFLTAREFGIKRITHCYNVMSPFHHRDIGLTGSALLYDDINLEYIADFIHTSKEAGELLYKCKKDKIQLVTDSIRAKNLKDGTYDLGGQNVDVTNGIAKLNDVLAGSTLHLNEAAKNMNLITKDYITLGKMLSTNQANELNLDHKLGKIKENYIADLTIVDSEFNVLYTIVNGTIKYQRGTE